MNAKRTAAALLACVGVIAAVPVAEARADVLSACKTEFWLTLGSTQRTICDGVRRPDGSWLRLREFWTPAHRVPLRTFCSGYSGYSSCTTSGGYWQDRTSKGIDNYIVFDYNVLPDEPGHLE